MFMYFRVTTEKCYPYVSGKNKNTDRCGVSRTQTRGTCPSGIPFRYESIYQATPPYRLAANVSFNYISISLH